MEARPGRILIQQTEEKTIAGSFEPSENLMIETKSKGRHIAPRSGCLCVIERTSSMT